MSCMMRNVAEDSGAAPLESSACNPLAQLSSYARRFAASCLVMLLWVFFKLY